MPTVWRQWGELVGSSSTSSTNVVQPNPTRRRRVRVGGWAGPAGRPSNWGFSRERNSPVGWTGRLALVSSSQWTSICWADVTAKSMANSAGHGRVISCRRAHRVPLEKCLWNQNKFDLILDKKYKIIFVVVFFFQSGYFIPFFFSFLRILVPKRMAPVRSCRTALRIQMLPADSSTQLYTAASRSGDPPIFFSFFFFHLFCLYP